MGGSGPAPNEPGSYAGGLEAPPDRARGVAPAPARRHLGGGGEAAAPRLVAMLVHLAQQIPELVPVGLGPREPVVVRTLGDRGHGAAAAQRVGDAVVQELGVAAPVGGDRR